MKIIHLPALGRAVFKEEVTEPFVSGKILVSVENTDGSSLPAAIYLCGSRINVSGERDGIYDGSMREGTHPLTVEIGGIRYHVGQATRVGNKVTFKSNDTYATFIEAAVLANKAYRKVVEYEERIKKLEIAANGVDLLNLN